MAHPAVTLRPARAGDAQAMAVMSRDFIESGLGWRYSPARITRIMAERDTMALVTCDAAGVQGFALMQFGDERAHLLLMCVQPAQRRLGLARRMIEWLVTSARVAGIASIHLELRADNHAAFDFYRRMGFAETFVVPGYYGGRIAARRMLRLLRAPVRPQ